MLLRCPRNLPSTARNVLCAVALTASLGAAKAVDAPCGKVLILVSNVRDMGDPDRHDARNNLWEVAPPFHVFLMHGFDVDFVSPRGGPVEFMMDPVGISMYAIRYQGFLERTARTLAPEQVDPGRYRAVYVGGGYGPMFDVTPNRALQRIVAAIYEAGGVVGGSGHGPAAWADVKLSDGSPMVRGKRVAGFPDSTERTKPWAKEGSLLPFLVEQRLRDNGAIALNKETLPDKESVVVDARLVSTMFLPSAALVAKEMVTLMTSTSTACAPGGRAPGSSGASPRSR